MNRTSNWVTLNALITDALNSPCTTGAPPDETGRRDLADALTDQLCNDVIVKDAVRRQRWWHR